MADEREQLIYEIACTKYPYKRFTPWEVLRVQAKRQELIGKLRQEWGGDA